MDLTDRLKLVVGIGQLFLYGKGMIMGSFFVWSGLSFVSDTWWLQPLWMGGPLGNSLMSRRRMSFRRCPGSRPLHESQWGCIGHVRIVRTFRW
jgi:hypothetical protein